MARSPVMFAAAMCLAFGVLALPQQTHAQEPAAATVETIDRVVVRWYSEATGGIEKPQFIMARQLAFESRVISLTEGGPQTVPYEDKHVRVAIQRHITVQMLATLPVDPKPAPRQIGRYAEAARLIVEQQVGGRKALMAAAAAEGISPDELNTMLRQQARASWYLDKMVAPMLTPTELDLREVHDAGETPFSDQRFEDVEPKLRRWYTSTQVAAALEESYRHARTRLTVIVISR